MVSRSRCPAVERPSTANSLKRDRHPLRHPPVERRDGHGYYVPIDIGAVCFGTAAAFCEDRRWSPAGTSGCCRPQTTQAWEAIRRLVRRSLGRDLSTFDVPQLDRLLRQLMITRRGESNACKKFMAQKIAEQLTSTADSETRRS